MPVIDSRPAVPQCDAPSPTDGRTLVPHCSTAAGVERAPGGIARFLRYGSRSQFGSTITGYSGSRNRRGYGSRSIPIEHARAQVVQVTRRQPVCESSRRVGRLRGHRLAGARTRTHSRHNDHLWRATGRGSAAGPPRPRHQPAFDSAEANPRDTQALTDFLMLGILARGARACLMARRRRGLWRHPQRA